MQPVLAPSVILRGGQRRCLPCTRYCLILPLGGAVWLEDAHGRRRLRRGELALLESRGAQRLVAERRGAAFLAGIEVVEGGDPRWPLLLGSGLLQDRVLARAALRWLRGGGSDAFTRAGLGLVDRWLQRCPGRSPLQRCFRLRPLLRARCFLQLPQADEGVLEHAAALAALSRFHFSRVFQRVFGIGPAELQRRWRIEQALRELAAGGQPVWSAAQRAGFARSSSFARACRRRYAATPVQLCTAGLRGGLPR
jgi:AraC family transcriptional regulator